MGDLLKHLSEAEYNAALARAHVDATTEIRARAVRYLIDKDMLEIQTTREEIFSISCAKIEALRCIPAAELGELEVWPDGSAIELKARDIQISVDGLLAAVLPAYIST